MTEAARTEGWGSMVNAKKAHYFQDGSSLCRQWMMFGSGPRWESNQKKGPTADAGTCAACWKKAPEEAP